MSRVIERGDSYQPLVELPPGEAQPTKDKIAFLKNLTRHMIGDLGQTDTSLRDNITFRGDREGVQAGFGSGGQQDADVHGFEK